MKKIIRNLCVLATALMCILMCIPSVSAKSVFDDATAVQGGKKYSFSLSSKSEQKCFKIEITKKGELVFKVNSDAEFTYVHVYDSDFTELDFNNVDVTSGKSEKDIYTNRVRSDSKTGKTVAKYTYSVNKGTYYIQFSYGKSINKHSYGKYSLSILSPESDNEKKSDSVDTNSIKLTLSAGDSISLGAIENGKDCTSAKWSTSDEKIAKVSSKGIITAVKEGSCTITWKSKTGSFTIYINVTK